jgi:hypothetical protein
MDSASAAREDKKVDKHSNGSDNYLFVFEVPFSFDR